MAVGVLSFTLWPALLENRGSCCSQVTTMDNVYPDVVPVETNDAQNVGQSEPRRLSCLHSI